MVDDSVTPVLVIKYKDDTHCLYVGIFNSGSIRRSGSTMDSTIYIMKSKRKTFVEGVNQTLGPSAHEVPSELIGVLGDIIILGFSAR